MIIRRFCLMALVLVISACESASQFPAPGNIAFTFINSEKKLLHDYQGNWLLINFWSVSCPPCFEEIPDLQRFYQDGHKVIGVAMPFDRPDSLMAAVKQTKIDYPVAIDLEGKINQAFDSVTVIPSSFLITPEGRIVKHFTGKVSYDQLTQTIQALTKEHK